MLPLFSNLETLDSYEGKLNGLLVARHKGKRVQEDKQWDFITTLPIEKPKQVLRAYDEYDKCSLVENKENRELKQGGFLLGWLSSRPAGYNLAELVAA